CAARAASPTTPGPPSTRARTEDPMPDCYPQLTDTQRTVRDTIRRIVETELEPHVEAMEHGDVLPYPYIKKLAAGLGMAGTGEIIGAWGLTEPGAGSDAFGSMITTARPDGDGFVLKGQKTFITNAPYADVFVIYAKLVENGAKNIQPFLIERGTPGLEVSKPFRKMGTHSSPTGAVYLDDVRIPRANLLGGGVKERDHVKGRLSDERAGMPTLSLGAAATEITMQAIHILGGNGYMEEYEVERLARDAKLMELGGGTTEIQELTIARQLVG